MRKAVRCGDVAQLGERGLCKPEVEGSSPFVSTILAAPSRHGENLK